MTCIFNPRASLRFAIVTFVALILALAFAMSARAEGWSVAAMNRQIDQTNVLVNNNCSGTLIDAKNGYVLTANHCIADQFHIVERQIIDDDGVVKTRKVRIAKPGTFSYLTFKDANEISRNVYVYKIVKNDENLDLALVRTKAKLPETMQAPIACKAPIRGETVYAVGNPYAVLYSSVTSGIVSSVDRNYPMIGVDDQGDHAMVQSSAMIAPGNSGGALYDVRGELVGVNVRGAPGITLSVPLADIKAFLMREALDSLWKRCESKTP